MNPVKLHHLDKEKKLVAREHDGRKRAGSVAKRYRDDPHDAQTGARFADNLRPSISKQCELIAV